MSSSTPVGRSLARTLKKVEAPRPLKDSSLNELKSKASLSSSSHSYSVDSAEKFIAFMDMVVNTITMSESLVPNPETASSINAGIANLCKYLKIFGPKLENSAYQGQLDRAFSVIREYMVRPGLECEVRANLLEIIELRSCNWITRKSLSPCGNYLSLTSSHQSLQDWDHLSDANDVRDHPRYQPLEVTAHLGTDELLARTVSVAAKERSVQITGPSEDNVSHAIRLIDDTIRNASTKSGSDSSFNGEDIYDYYGRSDVDSEFSNDYISDTVDKKLKINSIYPSQPYQYKHKVVVRNCQLTITGDDYSYVTVAKAVLDDYFSKLRAAELSDEDLYGDDVFADDIETKGTFGCNSISLAPLDSNENDLYYVNTSPIMCQNYVSPISNENLTFAAASKIDFKLKSTKSMTNVPLIEPETTRTNVETFNSLDNGTVELSVSKDMNDGKRKYTREFLLQCREREPSRVKPIDWDTISRKFPQIIDTNELSQQ